MPKTARQESFDKKYRLPGHLSTERDGVRKDGRAGQRGTENPASDGIFENAAGRTEWLRYTSSDGSPMTRTDFCGTESERFAASVGS